MALLSVANIDYDVNVLEQQQEFFVRKRPIHLIQSACLDGGSTYEGRRLAVIHQTGSKQKVPIPVDPLHHIFAFPTLSPRTYECKWIFYHHVHSIQAHRSPEEPSIQSIITFKNGHQLPMNETTYILEKQMQRTAMCILRFTNPLQESQLLHKKGAGTS